MNTFFCVLAAIIGFLAVLAGGFALLVAALLLILPGLCRIEPGSSSGNALETGGIAALVTGGILIGLSWLLIRWSTKR